MRVFIFDGWSPFSFHIQRPYFCAKYCMLYQVKKERNKSIYSVFCFGRMNKMRIKHIAQNNIKYIFILFLVFTWLAFSTSAMARISTQLQSTLVSFHLEFIASCTPMLFILFFLLLSFVKCERAPARMCASAQMLLFCVIPLQVAVVSVVENSAYDIQHV